MHVVRSGCLALGLRALLLHVLDMIDSIATNKEYLAIFVVLLLWWRTSITFTYCCSPQDIFASESRISEKPN
jgi:hypothetical protein